MSRIEKLINELCPLGVTLKTIDDCVSSIRSGLNPRDNFRLDVPGALNFYVTVKEITSGKIVFSDKTSRINDEAINIIQKRSCLEKNDVLLSGIGTIGKAALVDIDTSNWNVSESVLLLKPRLEIIYPKYLFYLLESSVIKKELIQQSVGSTLKGIRMTSLKNAFIPVPPLEVQNEIVRILDNFSALEAELEAELEARSKQYEYYRNRLLDFSDGPTGLALIDNMIAESCPEGLNKTILCNIAYYPSKRIQASTLSKDNYIGVENLLQNKLGKCESSYVPTKGAFIEYKAGDILIGNIRPYLKKIWYATNTGGTNGDVLVIRISEHSKNIISSRYLYYILSSDTFFDFDTQHSKGAKMPRGDKSMVMMYPIQIPPIAVQNKIVEILDNFSSFISPLTAGLPAEINARRQQYEYYRNKLLTF